jgi:hypothetical protein
MLIELKTQMLHVISKTYATSPNIRRVKSHRQKANTMTSAVRHSQRMRSFSQKGDVWKTHQGIRTV